MPFYQGSVERQPYLKIIGQDYCALSRYVDVFSPVVYHLMCGYPPEWVGEVVEEIYELSGKPVWPIIQSVSEPTSLSAEEYGRTIDVVLHSDVSDGILVLPMKGGVAGPGQACGHKSQI